MTYEGYEITNNTFTNCYTMLNFIKDLELTGTDVFNLFIEWHGAQLCTSEFLDNTFRVEYDMEADTPE